MQVKVPNLGDGVSSAQVLSIMVAVGDEVTKDQTLLELETDKAVAPVPSPESGKIVSVLIKEGDDVTTGHVIFELDSQTQSETPVLKEPAVANKAQTLSQPVMPAKQAVQSSEPQTSPSLPKKTIAPHVYNDMGSGIPVATLPSIRHAANLLGLNLNFIKGSGSGGKILFEDVSSYLKELQALPFVKDEEDKKVIDSKTMVDLPDFSKWGPVEIKPISTLRKKIADKMSQSWEHVPHVTQFAEADITELMKRRKSYKDSYVEKGAKLTVTVMLFKALVQTLQEFPEFNSSFDPESGSLIIKKYYHLGVAVDTPKGLLVPVLKDADKSSLLDLSVKMAELAEKARDRRLSVDDLQGGTFTLSNLGSFGVGVFTPIVNVPEVAILGMGRSDIKVVPVDKRLVPKTILPLALSYDHRVIDGADAARFVSAFVKKLENFDESILKEGL